MNSPARGNGNAQQATVRGVWACIAMSMVILHHETFRVPLFADDYLFLDATRGKSLVAALATPDPLGNFFRPLTRQLYFWLLQQLGDESLLVIHIANSGALAIVLLLFHRVALTLAGPRVAALALLLLAPHYTWDVMLRWASGTQDLFAIGFALGAILLHLRGRVVAAAACFTGAVLSKEVVVLLPVVTLLIDLHYRATIRSAMRRVLPYLLVLVAWAPPWFFVMASRGAFRSHGEIGAQDLIAALIHGIQVILGLEFGPIRSWPLNEVVLAVVVLLLLAYATTLACRFAAPAPSVAGRRWSIAAVGIGWALAGAIPITAVAGIWNAYYYGFALCGSSIAAAALLARRSLSACIAVVTVLFAGSTLGRSIAAYEVPVDRWSSSSHITPYYIDRATSYIDSYQRSLRRNFPTVPRRSTFYFAQIPGAIAWQVADGPYVRWAYRDTSLRSYYLSELEPTGIRRGPVYILAAEHDSLRDITADASTLHGIALRAIGQEDWPVAAGALDLLLRAQPAEPRWNYIRGWVSMAMGMSEDGLRRLALSGMRFPGAAWSLGSGASQAADSGASVRSLEEAVSRHPLDAMVHARLADRTLSDSRQWRTGVVEALAARVLAPRDPEILYRWALAQVRLGQYGQARLTLRLSVEAGLAPAIGEELDAALAARERLQIAAGETDGQSQIP